VACPPHRGRIHPAGGRRRRLQLSDQTAVVPLPTTTCPPVHSCSTTAFVPLQHATKRWSACSLCRPGPYKYRTNGPVRHGNPDDGRERADKQERIPGRGRFDREVPTRGRGTQPEDQPQPQQGRRAA